MATFAADLDGLFGEILMARERVYAVGEATPLERVVLPGSAAEVWVKREDLGPVKAYKWRGAFNAMAALSPEERARGIVAASAGNHAQGVALAARKLGCRAVIFMPKATPEVKRAEVARHGGEAVEIRLTGDTYDAAGAAAKAFCEDSGGVFLHPFDDLRVMGGQGTLAAEVVMTGKGPFDRVYVAIGGGGLAAAVACWLKRFWPEVRIIGVEGVEQASMAAAVEAGEPVTLDYVDVFCDGTAVRRAGERTFPYCRDLLDGFLRVSNEEVCQAVRAFWESSRVIPEPSGAMALAGFLQDEAAGRVPAGARVLTVLSGANMDFAQLTGIARRAGIGTKRRRALRVAIPEGRGSLVKFLREVPREVSIVDLQYGRVASEVQYPVLGLIGSGEEFAELDRVLRERGREAQEVTADEDVDFRIINYAPELFSHPLFVNVQFPERAGAFLQFMEEVRDLASLCYVNYAYSGERVGRALVGMEFATAADREACWERMEAMQGRHIRAVRQVGEETFQRLTGRAPGRD
ncbi:MAG: pyridoxal-phosphate dependent enzyme [Verrucomicrobiales bacterium]